MLHVAREIADADEHRQAGRLEEATAGYLSITAASPGNLRATVGLGLVAKRKGDFEVARSLLEEACAHHSREIWPRAELGLLLRTMNLREEAEQLLRSCLDDPDCPVNLRPTLLAPLGCLVRDREDLESAAKLFHEASTARPSFRWAQLELGRTLTKLERFDEAELAFRKILSSAPADLEALTSLGFVARQRGDRVEALARYRKAAEAHPRAAEPRAELAVELSVAGRLKEAVDAYRAVLEIQPQHPWAWLGLGHLLRHQGDREQARIAFSKAAAIDPKNVTASLECAAEARDAGLFEEAASIVDGVLKNNPSCAAAHVSLAQILSLGGDKRLALRALQTALEFAPNDAEMLVELSNCLQQLGEHTAAIKELRTALRVSPRHPGALIKLADLVVSDRPEEALVYYQDAAAVNQASPYPYLGITSALMELGHFEQALSELDIADQKCGSQPALIVRRSEIVRRTGRSDLARSILVVGSVAHPDSAWLKIKCLQLEASLGDLAQVTQDLERVKPQTVHEKGLWHFCRGQVAENGWHLADALHHYRCAVELNPDEVWFHHELARINLLCLDLDNARKHLTEYSTRLAGRSQRSANISRTHLGQILDEFVLDADALTALQNTLHLGESKRIQALRSIAESYPDSTAPSIVFLIAARQAGLFRSFSAPSSSEIPRALIQYWDTSDIPPDILELMDSWRRSYPDFDYHCFDDNKARTFLESHCSPDVARAYVRSDHPAQKADLFRLGWLYVRGGYYVDADDRSIARLEDRFPHHAELILYQEEYGTVGNNFIAAIPQHPVLGRALELAAAAVNRGDRDVLWLSTGPGLLTRALVQTVIGSQSLSEWLERIVVLDRSLMSNFITPHCVSTYKRTDRHWSHKMFGPHRSSMASQKAAKTRQAEERNDRQIYF